MTTTDTTLDQYAALQTAYDFLNAYFFDGALPPVLITLNRKANSAGYYIAAKFEARDGTAHLAEIALNPDTFRGRSDAEIIGTLLHEMVHHWQHVFGTPPRKAYHDAQWAAKMEAVGLTPTHDGTPSGKRTGQHMTHIITEGGAFTQAMDEFTSILEKPIAWQSIPAAKPKSNSKTKKQCPACKANAWCAPSVGITCTPCGQPMLICE